ncbi:hypothetical protein VTN77DRAFT_9550 [Rasamsonia byssochlamydoides]|uniref:uncharacterized protein n=1 Tax=Rasamsonia byssochlamydoides TaxID=89139 RepID=UPI003741F244
MSDHSSAAAAPAENNSSSKDTITLTVHHHGSPHSFTLPAHATLQDLSSAISSTLQIPSEHQKLLIAPKPGLQKPPFPAIPPLAELLPLSSPKFKITLLGSKTQEIDSLNDSISSSRQRLEERARARASQPSITRRPPQGIHTLSSPSSSTYTFHRLLPLPYLPNPERSLRFLERLRDDPGIRFAMAKHRFSVPLLTEMNPAEHTTHESRTLGLNRNKGEVIELRLRTDAYDGYRDYRTIRKTLCHELAHCVHSNHDRAFWELTKQIEQEVERADWTRGGHRLSEEEFYHPAEWEEEGRRQDDADFVDHGGWTGGEFVLGGSTPGATATATTGGDAGLSRRELLARAAEERIKREQQRGRGEKS